MEDRAASVLAWSLGHLELPRHDMTVTPEDVLRPLEFMSVAGAKRIVGSARLRTDDELYHGYNLLWQIHWRLVEYRVNASHVDLRAMEKRHEWWGHLDVPSDALSRDGDLLVDGHPLTKADARKIAVCSSIAVERHRAVNWVIGSENPYSAISTDT